MAEQDLIIDCGDRGVTAGVFEHGAPRPVFTATAGVESTGEEALREALAKLESAGYADFQRVVLGLPASEVSMRVIDTPIVDKKKIEEILPVELSDALIGDTSELKFDSIRLADDRVLGVAVDKTLLSRYTDIMASSGMEPSRITVSLFSRDALLRGLLNGNGRGPGEVSALFDGEAIVVIKDDRPLLYKEITGTTGALALSIESLAEEGLAIDTFYATPEAGVQLEYSGIEPRPAGELKDGETGLMALAAEMAGESAAGLNFRSGNFVNRLESDAVRSGARLALLFFIVLVLSWSVHTYLPFEEFRP